MPAGCPATLDDALRILLAVPAALLASSSADGAAGSVALGLVRRALHRTDAEGMRDLSAYCLRYQAQALGYLLLLTARYPTLYAVPA